MRLHPSIQNERFCCPNCNRHEKIKVIAECYVEVAVETDGDDKGYVADTQVMDDTVDCDLTGEATCLACGYKDELSTFVVETKKPKFLTRRERVEHLIDLHDRVPLELEEVSELLRLLVSEVEVLYPVLDGAWRAHVTEDIHHPDLRVSLADYKEGKVHE